MSVGGNEVSVRFPSGRGSGFQSLIDRITPGDRAIATGMLTESAIVPYLRAADVGLLPFADKQLPYYRGGGQTMVGYNDLEARLSYVSREAFKKRGYMLIGGGFGNPTNLPTRIVNQVSKRARLVLQSLPRLSRRWARASSPTYKDK